MPQIFIILGFCYLKNVKRTPTIHTKQLLLFLLLAKNIKNIKKKPQDLSPTPVIDKLSDYINLKVEHYGESTIETHILYSILTHY